MTTALSSSSSGPVPDPQVQPKRITASREHTLRGKKNLDWFFQNKRWVKTRTRVCVDAAFAIRPLPEGEKSLQFLFLASKRNYKRAHDRNRIKRWLREAVQQTAAFPEIDMLCEARSEQILIMLRIAVPLENLAWDAVLSGVQTVSIALIERSSRQKS